MHTHASKRVYVYVVCASAIHICVCFNLGLCGLRTCVYAYAYLTIFCSSVQSFPFACSPRYLTND